MSLLDIIIKIKHKIEHRELWYSFYVRMPMPLKHLFFSKKFTAVQRHYNDIVSLIKNKVKAGNKITVGFFVAYDAMFSAKPLFERMLDDELFEPYIVITPELDNQNNFMVQTIQKTYETYIKLYDSERVLLGYDNNSNTFNDYSNQFDIVYFSRPYDYFTHRYFRMEYLMSKNILTFHTNYCFSSLTIHTRETIILPFMNFAWKVFVENQFSYDEFCRYSLIEGRNISMTGYCKLDEYPKQKKIYHGRKRIILAPHHSLADNKKNKLSLSNFLEFSDFFLCLPKKYPEIDFLFRPHPLLFKRLSNDDLWGKTKTDQYIQNLLANTNVIYSEGDNYYDIFMNSSAMIHDCGSFVAEYLVTGHPCCYMVRDLSQLTQFGNECLEHYYKAFNETDIIDFIENVVIGGIDNKKTEREYFTDKNIKINYPNVSGKILEEIKNAINNSSCL
jgi:hypothetical protein